MKTTFYIVNIDGSKHLVTDEYEVIKRFFNRHLLLIKTETTHTTAKQTFHYFNFKRL